MADLLFFALLWLDNGSCGYVLVKEVSFGYVRNLNLFQLREGLKLILQGLLFGQEGVKVHWILLPVAIDDFLQFVWVVHKLVEDGLSF